MKNQNKQGILTIEVNDDQLSAFYLQQTINHFNQLPNTYLVMKHLESGIIDGPHLWDGKQYQRVKHHSFDSYHFGKISPKADDPWQIAYFDSLVRNQITFCTGGAGSGKSLAAFAYAFDLQSRGKLSSIILFCNPYPSKDSNRLGYLPGDLIDKLLMTSTGSILVSKIGSMDVVRGMILRGDIMLMPMSDCRGYEVPRDSFVIFDESQNTSPYLMKLFLQRLNDECKVVVCGDYKQTDDDKFMNGDNGLARAISVFVGEQYAGHVRLEKNYRGKISRRAELIC